MTDNRTLVGEKEGWKVYLEQDTNPMSPRDADNFGRLVIKADHKDAYGNVVPANTVPGRA